MKPGKLTRARRAPNDHTPQRAPLRWRHPESGHVLDGLAADPRSRRRDEVRRAHPDVRAQLPQGDRRLCWLTLLYNPGAAFGLSLGPYSRWLFTALTIGVLVVLGNLYRATAARDRMGALAVGLVVGGALGNLVNRLWSARGVVDWIDVGMSEHRWPAFNVADIGVSVGAALLALVLWREGPVLANQSREEAGRE